MFVRCALFLPRALLAAALCSALAACSTSATTTTTSAVNDSLALPGDVSSTDTTTPPIGTPSCDPLQPEVCALPWPSNLYLTPDKSRATGYRVDFGAASLPVNMEGKPITPQPWSRMDGYSVATPIVVYFRDIDVTQLPGEATIAASLAPDAQIVLLQVTGTTAERVPYFVELDQTELDDPHNRALFIRPAVLLKEATRYVVALRHLHDTSGKLLPRSPAFSAFLAGDTAGTPLAARQARFDDIFAILAQQGIAGSDLTLAWDFVTASGDAMHGRMLSMRDQAFAALPNGPTLTVAKVEEFTAAQDPYIALSITGTFHVPNFMEPFQVREQTGYRFHYGADGKPAQNGWNDVPFWIRVPRTALDGTPHGLVQYGHGLNGTGGQVQGGFISKIASDHHLIYYACNWTGMAEPDVPTLFQMLFDLSNFEALSDHMHQGMLESLLLSRAMQHTFTQLPEIKKYNLQLAPGEVFYSGISQGGIYGATYMALTQDVARGHLGVPGNNYSLLLQRSADFVPFLMVLMNSYPDSRDRAIILGLLQMLWDGTDPASYYRHIKQEPLPGNQAHDVLLAPAKGDWQVAPITCEIAARSNIGISLMKNYGRPVFGVTEQGYPLVGSGIVSYDFGNPWAPPGNQPPSDNIGDPHGKARSLDWHNEQMVHFWRTGEIEDVCGGDGCHPN